MRSRKRKYIPFTLFKNLRRFISPPIKDNTISDNILFNNYLLDKINSLEESGRQLISVYTILIAAYITVLMEDIYFLIFKNEFRVSYSTNNNFLWSVLFAFIITILPIFPWIFGIIISAKVLWPKKQDFENDSKASEFSNFLNKIIKEKNIFLKWSYKMLGLGIILVFLVYSLNMVAPIYFSYQDAIKNYDQHNYNESIRYCDLSIAALPGFEWPWLLKGECYIKLGNYPEAMKCYDESTRLNPNSKDAWNSKGLAYYDQQMYNESILSFDNAIQLDSNCPDPWFWKGLAHEALNEYDAAIWAFDNVTEIEPEYYNAWYHKGIAFFQKSNYDKAITNFNQAIMLNPNSSDAKLFFLKGIAHKRLKEYPEALKAFNNSLKIDPKYADAWYGKEEVLKELNYTAESKATFNRAIDLL